MTDITWMEAPALQANLTEPQFAAQIRDMAKGLGWSPIYHTRYSIGSDPGYPDLTLVHPRLGVCWFETKGGAMSKSRITLKQIEWIEALQQAGEHAYIVKPVDYDLVQIILRGEVPRPDEHGPSALVGPLLAYHDRSKAK